MLEEKSKRRTASAVGWVIHLFVNRREAVGAGKKRGYKRVLADGVRANFCMKRFRRATIKSTSRWNERRRVKREEGRADLSPA